MESLQLMLHLRKKVPLSKRKVIVLLHLDINSFQISLIRAIFSFIAVIWIKDPLLHEVSVAGLRQGVTKKNLSSSKARYMVFPFYYYLLLLLFNILSLLIRFLLDLVYYCNQKNIGKQF